MSKVCFLDDLRKITDFSIVYRCVSFDKLLVSRIEVQKNAEKKNFGIILIKFC